MQEKIIMTAAASMAGEIESPEIPWLLQFISDYRMIIMPILLILTIWMLAKALKGMFKIKKTSIFFCAVLFIASMVSAPAHAQGFKYYFNGVDLAWLKDAKLKDYGMMLLGHVTCIAIHELSHIAYLEKNDIKYNYRIDFKHQTGVIKLNYNKMTNAQIRRFNRAGYTVDTIVGLILTSIPKTNNTYFTRGYVATHSIGLATYDLRNKKGDFKGLKKGGGDEDIFRIAVSLGSAHNLLRQDW